jgi:hypothetical protein
MRCLWCGKPCGENFFCPDGGITKTQSNTGERKATKSYCFNDFLGQFKLSRKNGVRLTKQEQNYILVKPLVGEWYEQLPFENHLTGVDGE